MKSLLLIVSLFGRGLLHQAIHFRILLLDLVMWSSTIPECVWI